MLSLTERQGKKVLVLSPGKDKNHPDGLNSAPALPCYYVETKRSHCPVSTYILLKSKTNMQEVVFCYLKKKVKFEDPFWFTNKNIGKNKMMHWVKNISAKGVAGKCTAHCLRVTSVSLLVEKNVTDNRIQDEQVYSSCNSK